MATKIEVIRKRQLAQALVEKTDCKLKYALAVVDFIFDEIGTSVAKGIKVNIKDFGIFSKKETKAHMGINPATREPIKIKASVKPRFTASKALKEGTASKKYALHADMAALAPAGVVVKPVAKPAAKPAAKKAAPKAAPKAAAKKACKPAGKKPAAKKKK